MVELWQTVIDFGILWILLIQIFGQSTTAAQQSATTKTPTTIAATTQAPTPPVINGACVYTGWTDTTVNLTWPSSGQTSYYTISNSGSTTYATNVTANFLTITNLSPGTQYSFSVQPVGRNGLTGASVSCGTGYTTPVISGPCNSTGWTETTVTLTWPSSGQTSYYTISNSGSTTYATNVTANSITINTLTSGTQYSFSVQPVGRNGLTGASVSCGSGYTTPVISGSCNSTGWTETTVTLTWPSSGQTSYYTISNSGSTTYATNVTANSITINTLTSGTQYSFSVRPVGRNGLTGASVSCGSGYTKPYMSGNCRTANWTPTSVMLSWNLANATIPVTYNYPNSTSTNSPVLISTLHPGTRYIFTVYAFITANVTTRSQNITCSGTAVPLPPVNVAATALNSSLLVVSWDPDSENSIQDRFSVFYDIEGATETAVPSCSLTTETVCYIPPQPGTLYNISVYSFSGSVRSQDYGMATVVSFPNPPENVITTIRSRYIELRINQPPSSGNVTSYDLLLSNNSYSWNVSLSTTPGAISTDYTIRFLQPNAHYKLTIFSWFLVKRSEQGYQIPEMITLEDTPSVVKDFRKDSVTTDGVLTLAWSEPSNPNGIITSYTVNVAAGQKKGAVGVFDQPRVITTKGYTHNTQIQLTAGYVYNITIFASTIVGGGDPTPAITVEMPTAAPLPIKHDPMSVSALDDQKVSFKRLKVSIYNPFSNITGAIANFSVVVSQSQTLDPSQVLVTWSQSDRTTKPYIAKSTSVHRVKRSIGINAQLASIFELCDDTNVKSDPSISSCDVTVGADDTCANADICNGNLVANTAYYIRLRACNDANNCTLSVASAPIKTDVNHPLITTICLAVIIPCVVVIIVVVVLMLILCRKRDRTRFSRRRFSRRVSSLFLGRQSTIKKNIEDIPTSRPVYVDDFPDHVINLSKDSNLLYAEQYEDLREIGRNQSTEAAEFECNKSKNRYKNIKPYDVTRVKLMPSEDEEGSDYINASFAPGYYSKREFIATQGPLPGTKDDFWRMIWEYNCRAIVMLTNLIEGGKTKCDCYWPTDEEPVVFGDVKVVLVGESSAEHWYIRQLEISMGEQKRQISHYHYIVWDDMGVPENPQTLIDLVTLVRDNIPPKGGPIVAHCSAGVGRTGTYIALDALLIQLDTQTQIDVYGVVYRLRMNRISMVQTELQYVFLHECLAQEIQRRAQLKADEKSRQNESAEELYINYNG